MYNARPGQRADRAFCCPSANRNASTGPICHCDPTRSHVHHIAVRCSVRYRGRYRGRYSGYLASQRRSRGSRGSRYSHPNRAAGPHHPLDESARRAGDKLSGGGQR